MKLTYDDYIFCLRRCEVLSANLWRSVERVAAVFLIANHRCNVNFRYRFEILELREARHEHGQERKGRGTKRQMGCKAMWSHA
jgi:hypothetical protein